MPDKMHSSESSSPAVAGFLSFLLLTVTLLTASTAYARTWSPYDNQIIDLIRELSDSAEENVVTLRQITELTRQRTDSTQTIDIDMADPHPLVDGSWRGSVDQISSDEIDANGNIVSGAVHTYLQQPEGNLRLYFLENIPVEELQNREVIVSGFRLEATLIVLPGGIAPAP